MARSNGAPTSSASFPKEDAITRLVGAILLEQNDEWAEPAKKAPRAQHVEGRRRASSAADT